MKDTADEVKRRLVDDVGQLATDNGLDSDDVFHMIRVNNDLCASKWWYGFGKRSNFFNNELHKFAESRFNDWFEFTGEVVRQLDEKKMKKKFATRSSTKVDENWDIDW